MKLFIIRKCTHLVEFVLRPIFSNIGFFFSMIILMIIPTLVNAYFINPDAYIHYTSERLLGFWIKNGASFPFILFIPSFVSYLSCILLHLLRAKLLNKSIKLLIYSSFFLLYSVNIFLLFNFKTMISPTIMLLIEETTEGETSDFICNYMVTTHSLLAYFFLVVTILVIIWVELKTTYLQHLLREWYFSSILFVFLCYIGMRIPSTVLNFSRLFFCEKVSDVEFWYLDYPPDSNTLTNILYSVIANSISHIEIQVSKNSTLGDLGEVNSDTNATIVLVIGESFSKYHSSLYGYYRNTNPFLTEEKEKGTLFTFTNVISPYNMTSYVLKNLFSINSIMDGENWSDYPIFPVYFKKAGFNVYFWDNQKTKSDISDYSVFSYIYDSDISKISYTQCNEEIFQYDMDLVKSFFSQIRLKEGKKLLIFHLIGQHAMSVTKYPHTAENMYFSSDSISGNYTEKQKDEITHYDNATRYNDSVLAYLISQVRDKDCVIVYLSDHGEEVHDYRNHYGRTQENVKTANILKYQYEIPFMIWCSEKYQLEHQDKISMIKAALDKPFMNDNTCQLLFNLADIKCSKYIPERDPISPLYKSYKVRIVQGNTPYEVITGK